MPSANLLQNVVALAKRRGFIWPSSEIYGGLANTYDLGPLGAQLLRNIEKLWWDTFITRRSEIYGLDTSVIMSPKVWESSGHTQEFNDALIECKSCHSRTRADHLIENKLDKNVEGLSNQDLEKIIQENKIKCPNCGKFDWTSIRNFNLLFETQIGIIPGQKNTAYLRGETAQGMFVDFKNFLDSFSPKLPFGLAQSGKAFRNEITKGKFTFRTLEFHLAEFEYYVHPDEWEKQFEYWKEQTEKFALTLGLSKDKLRWRPQTKKELAHYSLRTEDLEYEFPFGFKELFAIAYRTDYDLKNHMEKSGVDLRYTDPHSGERFIPHVIEPTFGISRSLTAVLLNAFHQDQDRLILKLDPKIAPYQVAVFPLLKNKPKLVDQAKKIFDNLLQQNFRVAWDERGNIGKRYLSQDEIGTPFCVTVDFDTLEDNSVTIRHRDTTKQDRVSIDKITKYLK